MQEQMSRIEVKMPRLFAKLRDFLPRRGPGLEKARGAAAFRSFVGRLGDIRRISPGWLFWLLVAEYVLLFLLALWVPGNDFDSMSSYVARIKFAEWGPLRQTNTLEIQYLFPTFFDFLHTPFLNYGWFTSFPNFALFTAAIVAAVCLFEARVAARWILLMASAAPVLATVTALKNDISVALIGFLGWAIVFFMRPTSVFPATALTAIAALIGTKWHGFFVAGPLFVCLIVRAWRERATALSFRAALAVAAATPLLFWVSSASVYLDNLRHEGQLCPRPPYLQNPHVDPLRNAKAFVMANAVETFELPLYYADKEWMHGDLFPRVQEWTLDSKAFTYLVSPNSHFAAFGLPILLVVIGSFVVLFKRNVPGPVRASAAIALFYLCACLKSFPYNDWVARYFLTTYVLGAAPLAYMIASWRLPRPIRWAVWAWVLVVGFQSLAWNLEKPLVRREVFYANERITRQFDSIWPAILDGDRERLYFLVWKGHEAVRNYMHANVSLCHHLAIINRYQGGEVPWLWPHIKERKPALTLIVNDRYGQTLPPGFEERFEWIMVHNGDFVHPRYRETFRIGDVAFYRRLPMEKLRMKDEG
jgi:hypothetical protein